MHPAAHAFVARHASPEPLTILDLGGRDLNGSCRDLFPRAYWFSVDRRPGKGVDLVADATRWTPTAEGYDLVLCTEVLEHEPAWGLLLATARIGLRPDGLLLVTCAGPGRPAHSAVHGGSQLEPGEWYQNIDPTDLLRALRLAGFGHVRVEQAGQDVYAEASRARRDGRGSA